MYKIKADGVVLYDPSSNDIALQVLNPEAKFELNKAGSLEFTMLPGNVAYNSLQKMKTIVTLEQDGEVIFRGRVLETRTDLYNQKEVYCEGELAYLLDSLVRPYNFTGKASDLFKQLVEAHNEQVEDYKQFQVGIITAVTDKDDAETESEAYYTTMAEIRQMLIGPFGGYLRVRTSDGVRYLDYIDEFTDSSGQAIEFGVNLVDIEDKFEAQDVFSILVPLGDNKDSDSTITIESVNGGKDYIEDPAALAKYGRIVKTHEFHDVSSPQELFDKAKEKMAEMKEERTITITAVDMRIIDKSVDIIRLGDNVRLISSPHGLSLTEVCSKIEIDIENPDQSVYTLGIPPESLSGGNAKKAQQDAAENKKHGDWLDKLQDWLTITDTKLTLAQEHISENGNIISNVLFEMDAMNATIDLKADQTVYEELEIRMSQAEIVIDGAQAAIDLKADRAVIGELEARLTQAEVLIDGANAEIAMKATQSTVNALGERLSSAEVRINGAESKIEAKADLILLEGYVKMDAFEALESYVEDMIGDSLSVTTITAGSGDFDSLWCGTLNGGSAATQEWVAENFSKASATYKPTVIERYGSLSGTNIPVQTLNESGEVLLTGTVDAGDVYTNGRNSVTLSVGGWYGGGNTVTASNGKSVNISLPSFSTSGGDSFSSNKTTVYFYTGSVNGYLASKTVDATPVYNNGWNDCRDACAAVEVYTISQYAPGTLYVKVGDYYSSAGSSWVQVTRKYGVYTLPGAKS